MTVVEIVASVLILAGVALVITGAIGLHRFPDVFDRMHATSKPTTLGLTLTLIGTALVLADAEDIVKLLLVIAFQFITVPIAAHVVGRAAYHAGTELSPETIVDELADATGGANEPDSNP